MRILARLQEMAGSDILCLIPASEYERIKAGDKKPVFKAYVVGQEGFSTGRVEGAGNIVKRWLATAIQKLHEKIRFGTKVFHNHAETNRHEDRTPIGEIVGKALKMIDDRMSAVAVAYIKPAYRGLPLDVASIEADIRLKDDDGVYDADVGEITGVALGSSAISKPGFAGATLLAQIQEFADGWPRTTHGRRTMENELTIEEVRQFLKAKKITPSDVFDVGSLTDDPALKGYIDSIKKQALGEKRAHLEREGEVFGKEKKEWEAKEADYKKKLGERDAEIGKTKVPQAFEKLAKERKLTDQQKEFISGRLGTFTPTDPAKTEEELSKRLDSEIDEFKRTAKVFGVKIEEPPVGDKKPGGEPEPDKKKVPEGDAKYLDPAFNPMIPKIS